MNYLQLILFVACGIINISERCDSQRTDPSYLPIRSDVEFTVQAEIPNWIVINWRNFWRPATYIVLAQDFPINSFVKTESWIFGTRWLYDTNNGRQKQASFVFQPKADSGQQRTVHYDSKSMNGVGVSTKCFGYYAYFVDGNGKVLSSYCMKLYPTWMNDLKVHLGRFRIRELFIPGTHDSTSYNTGLINPISLIHKYGITQYDNIRQQLLRGVRYIDLRVGYTPLIRPFFWSAHGALNWRQLTVDLDQIRQFALETKEIIIVDMHNIENGANFAEVNDKLVQLLNNSLGDVMASPRIGWNGKLQDIWNSGRTVLVSYNNGDVVQKYPNLVWPEIQQKWPNVQNIENLYSYLTSFRNQQASPNSVQPFADMAEFTPTVLGVVTGKDPGLRASADLVNPHVNQWYFNDFGPTANIVAVDFLRGTSIVDAAIYWNLQRVPRS
ncbi:PI-PLC X domain-containing protein 2-like [Uranotaenia lowii]|uniref:PI-PLC X domain-containing protein 2-like n=1 Tax=Uranotaenia lowii TaxID=190385 RepID=UPI00247B272A|nr:PI-PLC X domain-containing protein 2-like [Uranotaenia lowii]